MPGRIIKFPSGSSEIDLSDTYYFRDSAVVNPGSLAMGSMDVFDEQEVAVENAAVFAEDGSTGLGITLSFTGVRANSKLLLSGASVASEAAKVYGLNSVSAPVEIATFSGPPEGEELPELQEVAIPEECIIDGAVTLVIMRMAAEPGAGHVILVCCIKHSFQGRDGEDGKDGEDGTTPSIADVAATAQTPPTLQYGEIAEGELTDALSSLDDGVLVLQAEDYDDSAGLAISFSNVVAGSKLKISAWGEGIGIFYYRFTQNNPAQWYPLPVGNEYNDESGYRYYDIPENFIVDGCVSVYIRGYYLDGGTLHIGHVSVVQTYKGIDGKDGYLESLLFDAGMGQTREAYGENYGKIFDTNSRTWKSLWVGTQAAYDLLSPNANTIYMIEEAVE